MLAKDEDAVICDLAQVYGVFDYTALPPAAAAALACGLPPDSRIGRLLSGQKLDTTTMLLAAAVDLLAVLCWRQTEHGARGVKPPASVLEALRGEGKAAETAAFRSAADFEAERNRIIARVVTTDGV